MKLLDRHLFLDRPSKGAAAWAAVGLPDRGKRAGAIRGPEERLAGSYRVRPMDNADTCDASYAFLVRMHDGTLVAAAYGHWQRGEEPYIVSVGFRVEELDSLARRAAR